MGLSHQGFQWPFGTRGRSVLHPSHRSHASRHSQAILVLTPGCTFKGAVSGTGPWSQPGRVCPEHFAWLCPLCGHIWTYSTWNIYWGQSQVLCAQAKQAPSGLAAGLDLGQARQEVLPVLLPGCQCCFALPPTCATHVSCSVECQLPWLWSYSLYSVFSLHPPDTPQAASSLYRPWLLPPRSPSDL